MDCDGRNVFGNSCAQSNDARDVRRIGGLADATKYDFVNNCRIDAGAGKQGVDGNAPQFIGAHLGQIGAHFAKGRSDAVYND